MFTSSVRAEKHNPRGKLTMSEALKSYCVPFMSGFRCVLRQDLDKQKNQSGAKERPLSCLLLLVN